MQRFAEGYPRKENLELISPLLAQPIVELCLSIPTWQWIEGGINRSVARSAYRGAIPDDILFRTVKGGPDAFSIDILNRFRPTIRELLLDGLLSANGILDRVAVDRYLGMPGPFRDNGYLRLLALVDAEAWARHWVGATGRSGATGRFH